MFDGVKGFNNTLTSFSYFTIHFNKHTIGIIIPKRFKMTNTSKKRAAILETTLELLVRNDLQSTSMNLIAKNANVGMGTIYNYFESKEVLINELFLETKLRLKGELFESYPKDASVNERFFHVWREMCCYYKRHPQEFLFGERYAYSPYINASIIEEVNKMWIVLVELFQEAQQEELIKDIPLNFFLPVVTGVINGTIRSHIMGQIVLTDELIETTINAAWDAVKK